VRETLGFAPGPEKPRDVRQERTWERDGIAGEEISWSVGYGPRTHAWLLRPAGASAPLPGGRDQVTERPEMLVAFHASVPYKLSRNRPMRISASPSFSVAVA
jgi:hypothetical protein